MAKSKTNRFEGFENLTKNTEVKGNSSTPRSDPKSGKSANPEFKKVTLYLSKELHLKMKSHTLTADENMSDLVERVMTDYLNQLTS